MLLANPSLFGAFTAHTNPSTYFEHLGLMWLVLGVGGLVFRVAQLFIVRDLETGLVWAAKIITDPFNDFVLYHRSPAKLARLCLAWRPANLR